MNHQATEFKRLNFFTGFFTTAADWTDGETYHLEKRRLHNRALHRPGILPGEGDELTVIATGGLGVRVCPGAVVDGNGNLITVSAPQVLKIEPAPDVAQTAYVYVRFAEQEDEFVENIEDPDFSGHTRKLERPEVKYSFSEPDGIEQVELARISLLANATEIKAPDNPQRPQANEVDRTHVVYAGARDPYFQAVLTRLVALHGAWREQQRRHNLGLHTPGVIPRVEGELRVHALGGLTVRVEPGAALDGFGNELVLDVPVDLTLASDPADVTVHYVILRFHDPLDESLTNLALPFVFVRRTAMVLLTTVEPDQKTDMLLARIILSAGATEIRDPHDPGLPQNDEINLSGRLWSKARGLQPERLEQPVQARVNTLMLDARENLAALAARFPTPSLEDVRTTALQLRLMLGAMEPEQLPRSLGLLADLEQDVGEELGVRYPPLVNKSEYPAYQAAVAELLAALHERRSADAVLNAQAAVNSAVRDLAEVVFVPPVADAGADQVVRTTGGSSKVRLDASRSQAAEGQKIVSYIWEEEAAS